MYSMNQSEWTALGWLCLQDDRTRGRKISKTLRIERKAAKMERQARQGTDRAIRDPMPRGKGRVDHDKPHAADQAS